MRRTHEASLHIAGDGEIVSWSLRHDTLWFQLKPEVNTGGFVNRPGVGKGKV